jgi:TolB protein
MTENKLPIAGWQQLRSLWMFTLAAAIMLAPLAANAVLRIEINKGAGVQNATPIAVVPFAVDGVDTEIDVAQIISDDLQRSGKFVALDRDQLVSNPATASEVVFSDWRLSGVEYVIVGKVVAGSNSEVSVQFALVDIVKQRQLLAFPASAGGTITYCCDYPILRSQIRRTAHLIADRIFEQLTGEPGIFDTQFAYISATGTGKERQFALSIADIDGENITRLLQISRPIMSPAWSVDGRQLAYVSFEFPGRSAIVVQDLFTAERRKLVSIEGTNGAPAWSPDGKRIAMSLSHRGSPDIYMVDVGSGRLTQLTNVSSIETEPEWLDNGRILFTSNRSGSPQIYVHDINSNGAARRLTFEGKYNASPSAAPDGSSFAFIHEQDGNFRIAVQSLESRVTRVLTDGSLDESPSFSPNGQLILYATKDEGADVLGVVAVDGETSYRISVDGEDVRAPAWGPMRR